MSRLLSTVAAAAVLGQLVGLLAWIDPIFIPLVLVGPPVTGVIAARRIRYRWIAVLWFSAGVSMLWTDWVITGKDQVFHLILSIVMPLLAGIGWGAVRLAMRRRERARQRTAATIG